MPNHPQVDILVRLAREDLAILHARKKIRESKDGQNNAKQMLHDAEARLVQLLEAVAHLKGEEQRLQQEIETYERRRATAHRVLETGNGNPEAAERQIEQCSDIISNLESQLINNLDTHEATEQERDQHKKVLSALKTSTAQEIQELMDFVVQCEQSISEKKTTRTHISTQLDPFLIKRYEQLRRSKGTAVARVVDNCCRSCRLALPMQDQSDLRRGREVACRKCGRWLFIAEE